MHHTSSRPWIDDDEIDADTSNQSPISRSVIRDVCVCVHRTSAFGAIKSFV